MQPLGQASPSRSRSTSGTGWNWCWHEPDGPASLDKSDGVDGFACPGCGQRMMLRAVVMPPASDLLK
jgi:hypothetical protein